MPIYLFVYIIKLRDSIVYFGVNEILVKTCPLPLIWEIYNMHNRKTNNFTRTTLCAYGHLTVYLYGTLFADLFYY